MFSKYRIPELIQRARTLYTVARDDTEIAALLAAEPYAYTPADYADGLALVDQLVAREADQGREYGEQYAATAAARQALGALESRFGAHRRLARRRHRRGTPGYAALRLGDPIPDADAALVAAAEAFYGVLRDSPDLYDGLRGINATTVTDALAFIQDVRDALDARVREAGEAERATHLRGETEDALRIHAGELAEVAKIALSDYPQLREKLGLPERS